ncbi:MAG TPA: NAD(P)-dependent oxidoreductase [Candidatus Nitrosocosmicus sp.]|nr:NAD(P)-dependent oxidoreductase [Candidatus Nitrosocosmicus sp.]
MNIVVLTPKTDFSKEQQEQLEALNNIRFIDPPLEHKLDDFIEFAKGAEILAVDPDNFGGFEKAKTLLNTLMDNLPGLKGLAIDTTSYGWVDLEYCKKRKIIVCNIPGYSRESVAEHTIALLLVLAKRIIEFDRKTQKNEFKLEMGKELKGKTLGIVGLGNIGTRTAEIASCLGMRVIAHTHSPKTQDKIELTSLKKLLEQSDAIAFHVTNRPENIKMIGNEEIARMKKEVIIVNTANREIIDEQAMAEGLKSGQVFGYAFEGEDLDNTPLKGIDRAIGIKGFGWYTKESMNNLYQIWTDNIICLSKNKPQNTV